VLGSEAVVDTDGLRDRCFDWEGTCGLRELSQTFTLSSEFDDSSIITDMLEEVVEQAT
jgi:hypothetical protein